MDQLQRVLWCDQLAPLAFDGVSFRVLEGAGGGLLAGQHGRGLTCHGHFYKKSAL